MVIKKEIAISDYCPHLGRSHTAYATIQKLNFCGDGNDYAKCVGFSCDFHSDCRASEDECPLLMKAQNIHRW